MAKYRVTVDFSNPVARAGLHEIERGGPVRMFSTGTLHEAVAHRNIALFAAGRAMQQGPRKMQVGQRDEREAGPVKVVIERLQ
ncbi:hypothetical protein AH2_00010 [Burkholderia phage vB_BceS_AH2]|uniref:Uncharacterized protein n=1 Tax=Burkholderia phage vB_BceS_AH2 TaxID=1133022 RepID=I6NSR1_9CAUD|nr:hypothetical protein B613_gp10 [Burkholderia phage vB_BceS_AH2]AEY69521.1 hypothetical protein AH2_00010 [Burkholderia phage vB_BceS_AH2]